MTQRCKQEQAHVKFSFRHAKFEVWNVWNCANRSVRTLTNFCRCAKISVLSQEIRAMRNRFGGISRDDKFFVPACWCNLLIITIATLSIELQMSGQPTNVEAWGSNYYGEGTVPPDIADVVAIAAGTQHNLVLKTNGTVSAWGWSHDGQTNVPAGLSNVVAIAAHDHSMALKQDGSVIVWGSQIPAVLNVPSSATNVIAISAGFNYSLALRADGSVVAWGLAPSGDTNLPAGPTNVTAISAGHASGLPSAPVRWR